MRNNTTSFSQIASNARNTIQNILYRVRIINNILSSIDIEYNSLLNNYTIYNTVEVNNTSTQPNKLSSLNTSNVPLNTKILLIKECFKYIKIIKIPI